MAAVGSEETLVNQANHTRQPSQPLYQSTVKTPSHRQEVKTRKLIDTQKFATIQRGQAKGSEESGLAGNKRNQEEEENRNIPREYCKY